ncbi:MAG: hypothetical protein FWD94_05590 [Treponema sp.]|nr:hypothetical protein [Treponema sp.]
MIFERSAWPARRIAISVTICVLTAAASFALVLLRLRFQPPVFLANVPFAAVTFALGPVAGIIAVALAWVARGLYFGSYSWYVIVTIIEMILIGILMPKPAGETPATGIDRPSRRAIELARVFGKLFALYVCCVIAASVSGGIISVVVFGDAPPDPGIALEIDVIFQGLLGIDIPSIQAAILARVQINLADRFLVVFLGYGLSLLYRRWLGQSARG